jgi:hypothetical protein
LGLCFHRGWVVTSSSLVDRTVLALQDFHYYEIHESFAS